MGLSVAKDELYYIYVLRVEEGGWYVGSTQNFERRMRSHFGKDGAIATKERRALEVEEVFELRDDQMLAGKAGGRRRQGYQAARRRLSEPLHLHGRHRAAAHHWRCHQACR